MCDAYEARFHGITFRQQLLQLFDCGLTTAFLAHSRQYFGVPYSLELLNRAWHRTKVRLVTHVSSKSTI